MIDLSTRKRYFYFKNQEDIIMLCYIHPYLLMVIADIGYHFHQKGYPPMIITRAIDEKIPGVSVSDTHLEGRAIDVSVNGLHADQVEEIIDYYTNKSKWKDIGAIGYKTGKRELVVYHVGTALHIHVQIGKDILTLPIL